MKVGVNGAVRDISDLKVGANGAVHAVSELWVGVNGAVKKVWPEIKPGDKIILDEAGASGTWICPASGQWEIEGHGAGGHGSERVYQGQGGSGGGGSGEIYNTSITVGTVYSYKIAERNLSDNSGGTTTFGEFSFPGGKSALNPFNPGFGVGSIATKGDRSEASDYFGVAGGYGNKNNKSQQYGNGGKGADADDASPVGEPGYSGAIILTYLG